MQILSFLDAHAGLFTWAIFGLVLLALYRKAEAKGFFTFLYETFSEFDPRMNRLVPSTKRMTLISSTWVLLWGYAKLTLAVCRWIDQGNNPTTIYIALALGVMCLAGLSYIVTKVLGSRFGLPSVTPGPDSPKS